jgi:hypothetical protein
MLILKTGGANCVLNIRRRRMASESPITLWFTMGVICPFSTSPARDVIICALLILRRKREVHTPFLFGNCPVLRARLSTLAMNKHFHENRGLIHALLVLDSCRICFRSRTVNDAFFRTDNAFRYSRTHSHIIGAIHRTPSLRRGLPGHQQPDPGAPCHRVAWGMGVPVTSSAC